MNDEENHINRPFFKAPKSKNCENRKNKVFILFCKQYLANAVIPSHSWWSTVSRLINKKVDDPNPLRMQRFGLIRNEVTFHDFDHHPAIAIKEIFIFCVCSLWPSFTKKDFAPYISCFTIWILQLESVQTDPRDSFGASPK